MWALRFGGRVGEGPIAESYKISLLDYGINNAVGHRTFCYLPVCVDCGLKVNCIGFSLPCCGYAGTQDEDLYGGI